MQTSINLLSNGQKLSLIQSICEEKASTLLKQQASLYQIQIAQLKLKLKQNEERLSKQQTYLADLSNNISLIQQKSIIKTDSLRRQLEDFRGYYNQCYGYTLQRVNEVALLTQKIVEDVQKGLKEVSQPFSCLQFVKYSYQLVVKIIKQSQLKKLSLKYELMSGLNELELEMGRIKDHIQFSQQAISELQMIKFEKESNKESIESLMKRIEQKLDIETSGKQFKLIRQEYEIKLRQVKKIINSCSIQVEMINLGSSSVSEGAGKNNRDEKKRLQNRNIQLEQQLLHSRTNFERIIQKKDELIRKKQQKILELSEQIQQFEELHLRKDKQLLLLKNQNKQFVKLVNQARSISQNKEQLEKILVVKTKEYETRINELNCKLQTLKKKPSQQKNSRWNDSIQQKEFLTNNTTKTLNASVVKVDFSSDQDSTKSQPCTFQNQSHQDWRQLLKQNEKLIRNNKQLTKYKKELEEELNRLLKQKQRENQEQNFYLDTMEAEAEQNLKEIQRLTIINSALKKQNDELFQENQKMKVQINSFVQKFQQQTASLRDHITQLQEQIQRLSRKSSSNKHNAKLSQKSLDLSNYPSDFHQIGQSKSILTDSLQAKQKNLRKILSKQQRQLIYFLKDAIIQMGWNTPIHCSYQKAGYIKQRKSAAYLIDRDHKRIRLSPTQLKVGIQNDLFVI